MGKEIQKLNEIPPTTYEFSPGLYMALVETYDMYVLSSEEPMSFELWFHCIVLKQINGLPTQEERTLARANLIVLLRLKGD